MAQNHILGMARKLFAVEHQLSLEIAQRYNSNWLVPTAPVSALVLEHEAVTGVTRDSDGGASHELTQHCSCS